MPLLFLHPCKPPSLLSSSPPSLSNFPLTHTTTTTSFFINFLKPPTLSSNLPYFRKTHILFCSNNENFEGLTSTHWPNPHEDESIQDIEGLGLLGKPTHKQNTNGSITEIEVKPPKPDEAEALKPFLKFFKPRDSLEEASDVDECSSESDSEKGEVKKVIFEYYDPKPGDFVIGLVVSGNESRLDVNVGADCLGTMLTKEVLPLYNREMEYLLCDTETDAEEFMVFGKMGIVRDDEALSAEVVPGRPVVEPGTMMFAEVLGRTLSGRPLLSTRRFFRRIAWHRVRQIKQLNEPIEVKITEWNTGGLLTRIEGLRAFLPKNELMGRANSFTDLKDNVGRRLFVHINRIDEANNDLILSEKSAWETLNLREGTLLEGTVRKIFPYGAQIRIGETNRSGLLHISNLTKGKIVSVGDLLSVDERVKVLVVKSMYPGKISLSTADLESEPGLFVSNKEKVFSEAEVMARKYRQKLPTVAAAHNSEPIETDDLPFINNETSLYSNWKWFKFEA